MTGKKDPVEEWRQLSAQAAQMTAFRPRRRPITGRGVGRSLGPVALGAVVILAGLAVRGLATTGPAAPSGSLASESPSAAPSGDIVGTADDGMFRLTLTTERRAYGPDDSIEPVATVTYLGPADTETIFHATEPILFRIEEVGGRRVMDGGTDLPCKATGLTKGVPSAVRFGKSGSPTDDASAGFDRGWYEDPVLRLPAGTWRVIAWLDVALGDCGGEPHTMTVENTIEVGGVVAPTASPSLSPDAAVALELVRKYEDALATGHPEGAWVLLSPWSKSTTGSSATFADAERRAVVFLGSTVEIGNPVLLDSAVEGDRAADVAASADIGRAYVVPVRHPDVGAMTDLVVAPTLSGEWKIWIDGDPGAYGQWPYPEGCAAFELSARRCEAVIDAAAVNVGFDRASATAIYLAADPGCGTDPLTDQIVICTRTTSFVAGIRFESANGAAIRSDVYCGVGPPSLVCSETPGIQAIDLHNGYWDVPCTGEAPDGCASPILIPTGSAGEVGKELRIDAIDVPVGPVGHREVELGTAILVNGIVQEATFSVGDQIQDGFVLDPGVVRMELRSTLAGRPPFDNIYSRGTFDGAEIVQVFLIFDVTEADPGAMLHIRDVLVR